MNWRIKDAYRRFVLQGYVDEFMTELKDDRVTKSMVRSTEHLLPPPPPPPESVYEQVSMTDPETGETTTTMMAVPQPAPPPPEPNFDVYKEASKLPLEVAVACSILSVPPERQANLANSILVLGGGGAVEGISEALNWR